MTQAALPYADEPQGDDDITETVPPAAARSVYWDQVTQDRWFFAFLGATTVALFVLFSPYLYVLLFATVAATVTWPVFEWFLRRVGGQRRTLAAALTMTALFTLVIGPLSTLGYLFVREAGTFVQQATVFVNGGGVARFAAEFREAEPEPLVMIRTYAERWVPAELLPQNQDIIQTGADWANQALGMVVSFVGGALPQVVEGAVGFGLHAAIFLFALFTLYIEGPRVLRTVHALSPMEDRYEVQLFAVFKELANNLVIASVVTALLQGTIAGIGYSIVGVDSVIFLAILSAVASFVPLVGTAFVWGPTAIYVTATYGLRWGVFVAVWNLVFTGSVDNVVRPLFMRGSTRIHPLLIFLSVFGGLAWFGVTGALVGPLIVAFFLAAYTIYAREYLGEVVPESEPQSLIPAWIRRRWPGVTKTSPSTDQTP